jgi:hypothetical protein
MSLTDIQKQQIRLMVSCNPTVANMERIAGLNDEAVLAELETFKTNKLVQLAQEKTVVENEVTNCTSRLSAINDKITLLES